MDIYIWIRILIVVGLLALSAFFSSVESALFSLSRSMLDKLQESEDPRARRVAKLMNDPRRLLATILTGNTIVNTAAAAITALLAVQVAPAVGIDHNLVVTIKIIVITIMILFFAEIIPKLFAIRNPENWAIRSSAGLRIFCVLLSPLAIPISRFTAYLAQFFGIEKHSVLAMTEDEIRALIQVGHEHGALEIEERKMIHSIFEFGDTIVREVMVPRIDMVTVEKNDSYDDILQTIFDNGHSRIPVYEDKVDNIVGMIYAKDLLQVAHAPKELDIMKLLRPAYFVPEEKKIDDLLREFQSEKIHIAIAVDEYGGTAGLVTMEDIIEEIVGEIQDEYDSEQPMIRKIDENTISANGRISIGDLNEEIDRELIPESEAYDTLAGFVFSQLGEVPHKGQDFEFEDYKFVVEEVLGKRISRIRLEKLGGVFENG